MTERKDKRGFTLVEAVIVAVVIAVILSVGIPYFQSRETAMWQALADAEPNEVFEATCEVVNAGKGVGDESSFILVHIRNLAPYPIRFKWEKWAIIPRNKYYSSASNSGGPKAFTLKPGEIVDLEIAPFSVLPNDLPAKVFLLPVGTGEVPSVLTHDLPQCCEYVDFHHSPYLVTNEVSFPKDWTRPNDGQQ
jgi:prepilin-type N-terminal cleavage/methylation domain-containing protein